MMTKNKHTKNGMVNEKILFKSGFNISINITTGIEGESTCLIIEDQNIYPDNDSRNETKSFIVPLTVKDLKVFKNKLSSSIKERNKTLVGGDAAGCVSPAARI